MCRLCRLRRSGKIFCHLPGLGRKGRCEPGKALRRRCLPPAMSDHDDFLHFFRQTEPDLRAFIGSVLRDPHAREDVFQEVSRTLWQKFDEFDLSRSFRAWARGIAGRKMLEARRRNARFPLLFPPETVEVILGAFDE
ncbi:MAG: hypothetical protein EOP86_11750, partial [Verrucomicrobiaceae bacterium]